MTYDNRNPNRSYGGQPRGGAQNRGFNQPAAPAYDPEKPEPIPAEYAAAADAVMGKLKDDRYKITTSKLRNLFDLFTETYNELPHGDGEKLNDRQKDRIRAARVRIIYEIGRDASYKANIGMSSGEVGRFVQESKILNYLAHVRDSAKEYALFYHYFEALVAYHRFYINR